MDTRLKGNDCGRAVSEILLGSTPRKRIDGPSILLFAGIRPILCHPREYLAVKFIFFLVEQCNQPWHLQNYATQVERRNERRFLARRSLDGAADTRMQIAGGSSLRRWNPRARRKAEGRKKARAWKRESYFDFTSGAICVRKSWRDTSKRWIALAPFLTQRRERYNPLCAPSI